METIEVKKQEDCPLWYENDDDGILNCVHPKSTSGCCWGFLSDDCPLRKGAITVKLADGGDDE